MSDEQALDVLRELAAHHGLQIKTYCLWQFNCLTVPEAIEKVKEIHAQNQPA